MSRRSLQRLAIVAGLVVFQLQMSQASADPSHLTRNIGQSLLIFGVRQSGMGSAHMGILSPATLWKLHGQGAFVQYGLGTMKMDTEVGDGEDTAVYHQLGVAAFAPLPDKWGVQVVYGHMFSNDYNQQDNSYAPSGPQPYRAKAKDDLVLVAVGKYLGKGVSVGIAQALWGRAIYRVSSGDNYRVYEDQVRLGPNMFTHWQPHPKLGFGLGVNLQNSAQVYRGPDFANVGLKDVDGRPITRIESMHVHHEYKVGAAFSPWKGGTIATDVEVHTNNAGLHPYVKEYNGQKIRPFAWSLVYFAGVEQFVELSPKTKIGLRAGVFHIESPTAGITYNFSLGSLGIDLDGKVEYAFVGNRAARLVRSEEPGLFGKSSQSHALLVAFWQPVHH